MPATRGSELAISCAICRGAFFSRLANSKHTGEAASPSSSFGGRSSVTLISQPYFSLMCAPSASRNRWMIVRYTVPQSAAAVVVILQYSSAVRLALLSVLLGLPL